MECLAIGPSASSTILSSGHNERRTSSTTSSRFIRQKHASNSQSERRLSGVGDMSNDNANNKEQQLPADRQQRVSSSSSIAFSPALECLESNEVDDVINKGLDECTKELSGEKEEEKVQLLKESATRDQEEEEVKVAAAWMVMEQVKRRPTLKQTWKEVHRQSHLGFPIAASNMIWFARFMVSTVFLGQLGGLELAAGTLALTFANVAGWSVLIGLAGGLEAICSQAHGAGRRELLDLTLMRGFVVLLMASVPIAGAWCKAEGLLLLMGQTPELARAAQSYLLYLLPDLLATSLVAPLRIFLRSQCITKPLLLCSLLALFLHVPLNYLLVITLRMGAPGTALAVCVTDFALALMLLVYVLRFRPTKPADCGDGTAHKCTSHEACAPAALTWGSLLKLAVPCCLMTCMEGWCYELIVLLTGLLPQAKEAVETVAIVLNSDTLLYALEVALASCVCTRVGNELGAKRPVRAYHATVAALWVGTALGCGGAGWLLLSSRMAWGRFFTNDAKVLKCVAQLLPIMTLIEVANFPQNVACGVLRGTARPAMGALINLGAFYVLGIPLAILLGFKYKMGLLGLWIGLATAAATTAILTITVVLRTDWGMQTLRAHKLTNQMSIQEAHCSTPDEQPYKQNNAEPDAVMPPEEYLLSEGFRMKGNYGDSKVNAVRTKQLNLKSFEQPLADLREMEHEDRKMNKRMQTVEDQFVDGNWKLLKTGSGRQTLGKSYVSTGGGNNGHLQDGHCWEVSMSMMNESARKCAMMARLEDEHLHSKKSSGCSHSPSHDMKRMVFKKLRLFTSKKSQPKKVHPAERRRTA